MALKNKFIGEDNKSIGDFKLFKDNLIDNIDMDKQLYFRSDNLERTLSSGQALLSG